MTSTLSPRYVSPEAAARRAELLAGIDIGYARIAAHKAAEAKLQVSEVCASKEVQHAVPQPQGPVILGGAQSADQPKRPGKRDLRHVMTTIAERRRKYAAETGFDMITCQMVDPPMEQWDRPECMPLYWRLMVSGDATPPLSALSPGDQEQARWLHDEELVTIYPDGVIRCLSDADQPEQRRYPGSPLPDPCTKKDGQCTSHTAGPCPKIASNGSPYHAGIGKYLGPERAQRLILAGWSAIKAGRPYAQIAARHRGEMTRKGGIRVSTAQLCTQANAYLAQLKVMHPEEWGPYRYMSTDVAEEAVSGRKNKAGDLVVTGLLQDGELTELEPATLTRIGHTEVGLPRAYEADAEEMAGWVAYAGAVKPRFLRRNLRRTA
jgi:hypothetical protein